jgi:hypothetical protein
MVIAVKTKRIRGDDKRDHNVIEREGKGEGHRLAIVSRKREETKGARLG